MVATDGFLTKLDSFFRTMHVVREPFALVPDRDHIGTCINYADLQEMRSLFVRELTNTVTTYVYSNAKREQLKRELVEEGREDSAAWNELYRRARDKFRPSSLKGQFSELLLCNMLQHHFGAVPLVRKMAITTNPTVERHGADAIHIKWDGAKYLLYVGEAKTYNRSKGGLREALSDAINDVIEKHYARHRDELALYTFEDFVPPELEDVARGYLAATMDVEVHLVCIVTYDHKGTVDGANRIARLNAVIDLLRRDTEAIKDAKALRGIDKDLMPRMNYILFPVAEMDDLIDTFARELGR